MTDTNQAADAGHDEQEGDSPETIATARDMGWKPESEWRGDPPKGGFTSATEFVRRGEKIVPILRADNKKAKEEIAQLRAQIDRMEGDHRDTVKRIERMSTVALENQRLQITSQYAQRKEAAVEVGDTAAYRQANKDESEALKAIDDRIKDNDDDPKGKKDDDKPKEFPKEVKEVLDAWYTDNAWFNDDEEMRALATARHMKLLKEKKGLTLKENLEEVRDYIKKKFPEHFGAADDDDDEEPQRRRGSPVEGGSRLAGGGGGSKFSKLPAEAKAAADKFIKKDKLFLEAGETPEKNLAQARERYATQYFGDTQ